MKTDDLQRAKDGTTAEVIPGGAVSDDRGEDDSTPNGAVAAAQPEHGRIGYGRWAHFTPAAMAVLVVIGLGLLGLARTGTADEPTVGPPALQGRLAPAATVRLLDGSRLALADLRGSVVVLNFWASYCAPCRDEAPVLQRLHDEARQGGEPIAGVGVGIREEPDADARAFVRELGLTYPIGRDNDTDAPGYGPLEQAFGLTLLPTTVIIRPDGVVDRYHLGPLDEQQLRAAVSAAQDSVAGRPRVRPAG